MKISLTTAIGVAATLALSACGAPSSITVPSVAPAGQTMEVTTASEQAAADATAVKKSSRGNLIKAVGVGASTINVDGESLVNFVIRAIDVNAECTSTYGGSPENGYLVVLSVEAQTTPDLGKEDFSSFSFANGGWTVIAENGTTQNARSTNHTTDNCLLDADRFPASLGPDEKAAGKIVLDVVSPSGTLIFKTGGSQTGWEWNYSAS